MFGLYPQLSLQLFILYFVWLEQIYAEVINYTCVLLIIVLHLFYLNLVLVESQLKCYSYIDGTYILC